VAYVEVVTEQPMSSAPGGGLRASGPQDSRWEALPEGYSCLSFLATVPAGAAEWWLDLSAGSDERRFAAKAVEQHAVRFVWVNEGVDFIYELSQFVHAQWSAALRATEGVDAATWRGHVAEARWGRSASWRPDSPVPQGRSLPAAAAAPPGSSALFAPRAGDVPADGTPTVAGITLPRGSRCGGVESVYWATYEPITDPARFTTPLAAAFPSTGLWPVLWEWDEDPESYMGGHGDLDALGRLDADTVLHTMWESYAEYFGMDGAPVAPFPGMAAASPSAAGPLRGDPFDEINDDAKREQWEPPRRLLLVPCHRPADALAVLDWNFSQIPMPLVATVLRSWEERLAAVVVALEPSAITLHIGAPPATIEQALGVAAELMATVEAGFDELTQQGLAQLLLTGRIDGPDYPWPEMSVTPTLWRFAFFEECPDRLHEFAGRG
jgi:hypothetical protein